MGLQAVQKFLLQSGVHASLVPGRRGGAPIPLSFLHWAHHITSQPSFHSALESVARCHRGSPCIITMSSETSGTMAITTVPEAALAYSHGDPLPTWLHPVNNRGDTTHKSRQRCPALNHTRCLLLTGSARHADRSVSR